jgi:hypothetical protein
MKLRSLVLALALASFAWVLVGLTADPVAACTAPCTKAQISTDVATNWPDNTAGAITPAILRSTVLELVNSYLDVNGASTFTCPTHQFLVSIATLSSYACAQPVAADIASGAALTKTDDTNVTLTLGGTPASALLAATSITAGWTGTLAAARGGTGDSGTAWSSYSAGVTCGTATITTTSSRSKTLGKTTWLELDFTITAIGSCVNTVQFNLPNTAQSGAGMVGKEIAVSGKVAGCSIQASAASAACVKGDTTNFIVNEHFVLSGVYENQ